MSAKRPHLHSLQTAQTSWGALAFSIRPQPKCSQPFVRGAINKFGLQMMALHSSGAVLRPPQQQRNKDSAAAAVALGNSTAAAASALRRYSIVRNWPSRSLGIRDGSTQIIYQLYCIHCVSWLWPESRMDGWTLPFRFFFYFYPDERNLYNDIYCVSWDAIPFQFCAFIGKICWRCPLRFASMHGSSRKRPQAELFPERCYIYCWILNSLLRL